MKAAQRLRVRRESVRQKLQRSKAVQLDVFCFVHHAHSAAANSVRDAIMRNRLTNEQVDG